MKKKDFTDKCIWVFPVILVCMLAAIFFCIQKKGYHEDEYYSYYSTARTNGLFVEDQTWKTREEILREYTVLPGEGFRYGLVREVQSWDVHPPVYYWILHTVESLFPGQFNKWIGLSVNLAAYMIGLLLFARLSGMILPDRRMVSLAVPAYGLTPAALSGIVFIRMYAVLTVFVLWAAILHCRHLRRERLSVRDFFLPLAVCTYLGFLTQYYYFVFLFFIAGGFCIYRLAVHKRIKDIMCYGMTMAAVFGAAYLTYPAFPGQMFRGQRGAQAAASFFDLSNTWSRIAFFFGVVSKYAFGGMLPLLCLLALVMAVFYVYDRRKKSEKRSSKMAASAGRAEPEESEAAAAPVSAEGDARAALLACSAAGYFLAVSKTGLLLGDSSIRYQMPVCGIMILAALYVFGRKKKLPGIICAAVLILLNIAGLCAGRVLFLYEEDDGKTAFARQCAEQSIPAVYFYDSVEDWCIWDSTNELLMYPEVFFCDQSGEGTVEDGRIKEAEKLVVYISALQDEDPAVNRVFESCRHVTKHQLQYEDTFCKVYLFE